MTLQVPNVASRLEIKNSYRAICSTYANHTSCKAARTTAIELETLYRSVDAAVYPFRKGRAEWIDQWIHGQALIFKWETASGEAVKTDLAR